MTFSFDFFFIFYSLLPSLILEKQEKLKNKRKRKTHNFQQIPDGKTKYRKKCRSFKINSDQFSFKVITKMPN